MQCLNVTRVLQERHCPLEISYLTLGQAVRSVLVGQTVTCFGGTCGYLSGVVNKVSDLCIE